SMARRVEAAPDLLEEWRVRRTYCVWKLGMQEVANMIRKIAAQTDLVVTVAQINTLKIASCDCHDKAAHKPDPNFVKQINADLKDPEAMMQFKMEFDAKQAAETVRLETAKETRERLAKMIASVQNIGKNYVLEAEKRGIAFDC
ncbi:hypothetical protein PMAYCL1PPCAC_32470, partial [Pristionchus mayeri]